jgi:NitT/TauT family transport system substrate-binding protein
MVMRVIKSACTALVVGALLALAGAANAADPVKIRYGWIVLPASWGPLILEKKDLMPNFGKTYVAETLRFPGSSPMITAIASGDIEFALLNFASFAAAIENANMTDLRIVADEVQDGVRGYDSVSFAVLKDGPIKKVEDLKGRIVGTNARGTAVDMGARAMLRRAGLEDKRDYNIVEVAFPNMVATLNEKKIDLGVIAAPWSQNPKTWETLHPLFQLRDSFGVTQLSMWVGRQGFLEKNRAAVTDFFTDFLRVARWYLDEKNHDAAVAAVANGTKLPPETFKGWVYTKKDLYRDPDGKIDASVLQKNMDLQQELGFQKTKIDASKYVDMSSVEEAAKRLK